MLFCWRKGHINIKKNLNYDYLNQSGLLNNLFTVGKGNAFLRKTGKIYLNNSNLLHAINRSLKIEDGAGGFRETFFMNQVSALHKVLLAHHGDFCINDECIVEVGGQGKDNKQVRKETKAYLAIDNMQIGFGNKIPLYLFGLLY